VPLVTYPFLADGVLAAPLPTSKHSPRLRPTQNDADSLRIW